LTLKGYSGTGADQVCIYCHTPHNANGNAMVPLWNHATTTQTYTVYSSNTLNATVGQPGATSNTKACLSCHDGSVALDNFGTGRTGSTNNVTGSALLGTALNNDHPVSFTYNAALATTDGGLVSPDVAGAWVNATLKEIPLFSGQLECASCHNVHDNTKGNFLRVSNGGSALCLKCHVK
jgi:predicted CXXCH cytochrome family protein